MLSGTAARLLEVEHLHQPDGWLSPGYLVVDAEGVITSVSSTRPPGEFAESRRCSGFALPGMPNLHSHAFQRVMAGRAEAAGSRVDSFWTWREAMYDVALSVGPSQLRAIAAQVFAEMLAAGMTTVGEFHYLHHDPSGGAYDDPAELSRCVLDAAQESGIAIALLPVFYAHGGIGRPAEERQRRFVHGSVDAFLLLLERVIAATEERVLATAGAAPHSLRAVSEGELGALIDALEPMAPSAPIHIHIAEQAAEVSECVEALGARPIELLADRFDLGPRWTLVHATHGNDSELGSVARSGAVVGLCPTTEANLGDGIFALDVYLREHGAFGIGSDSQVTVSAADELRLLEYSQRLSRQTRCVAADPASSRASHVGRRLYDGALAGGARALAHPVGELRPGKRADIVVLSADHPALLGHDTDTVLDAYVFSAGAAAVRDVFVAGDLVVSNGGHVRAESIRAAYERALGELGYPR